MALPFLPRLAPDIGHRGRSVDHEAERLVAVGAQQEAVHSSASGKTWIVMRDPEGDEFCLVPALADTVKFELIAETRTSASGRARPIELPGI